MQASNYYIAVTLGKKNLKIGRKKLSSIKEKLNQDIL